MGQGERKSGVRVEKTVRRLNKGKKSSNSLQLNVPVGGVTEGESRRRTKGYELTILVQGCRFTTTEQRARSATLIAAAMFQSLTSPFCSSARRFSLLYYFYFNYSRINTFPWSSSAGKSPACWTNIHALHNPMGSLHQPISIPGSTAWTRWK